jgi:uncharacterized membrane protein HdeD (DUF308 family)
MLELNNHEWQPAPWRRGPIGPGGSWLLVLVNGLLSTVAGVVALAWRGASLALLALLFVVTLLANGMVQTRLALTDRDAGTGRRVLLGVLGPLSVLGVLGCLLVPADSLRGIAWLIGGWLMVSGGLTLAAALRDTADRGRGWAGARGALCLCGGLIVVLQPEISLLALGFTLGLVLVALGVLLMIDAVRLRAA